MDLKGQLVKLNEVILTKEVNDAFLNLQKFVLEKQKQTINLKVNGGYMSKYRLVEELCKIVRIDSSTPDNIKVLIDKAKSPEDFVLLCNDTTNFTALENYLNSLKTQNFNSTPNTFKEFKTTDAHTYFKPNIKLYGVPNRTTSDPRRSGNFIVLDNISTELFNFLVSNAPSYGFIWYGIDKSYWLYDPKAAQGDSIKSLLSVSNLQSFFS